MSAPITRPGEWGTLGNHERRIGILEASVPGEGGSAVVCTGCYEIDPEFASCVDLVAGTCIDVAEDTFPDNVPATRPVVGALIPVGPYQCNYNAGFRLQVRYAGNYGGGQMRLYFAPAEDPDVPPTTLSWQEITGYFGLAYGVIDTGWVTYLVDPGAGTSAAPWTVYLGGSNGSVLFPGLVGDGRFCMRWVAEDDVSATPTPTAEGQILIATGTPPVWVNLNPGSVGEVLTIGAGGIPEWA